MLTIPTGSKRIVEENMNNRIYILALFFLVALHSQVAHATTYRVCLLWEAFTDDSGNGEDHYASSSLWKARGNRYSVLPASGSDTILQSGYTEQSGGCFNLTASGSSFRIRMFLEAIVGDNVKITAHKSGSNTLLYTMIDTGTLSTTSTNYLVAGNSNRTNIMGIAQYVAYQWLSSSPSGISDIAIRLREEQYPTSTGDSSCASWGG
jgi:hypothetical protein